jgi:hypothetical protein
MGGTSYPLSRAVLGTEDSYKIIEKNRSSLIILSFEAHILDETLKCLNLSFSLTAGLIQTEELS